MYFKKVFLYSLSTQRRSTQKQNNNGQQQNISTNHVPSWLQHFNFLSLLNLPDTMDLYGPLVNMWEGGNRGEGFFVSFEANYHQHCPSQLEFPST